MKVEILNAAKIRDLEPALAPIFQSAVYLPEQGQCPNPGRLVVRLAEHAVRGGARLTRARVATFELGAHGPVALRTEDGRRIACDGVVLAAGVWSAALARQLGERITLESERGYHVVISGDNAGLRIQTISADRKFVASPMEVGLRIAGNVELAGLIAPSNMARADALLRQARPMFVRFPKGPVIRWMGHRPGTPDSIPVLGRATHHANVIHAFGHGHQGLIAGAVTGRIVADLAAGATPMLDLTPFRPDRFRRHPV